MTEFAAIRAAIVTALAPLNTGTRGEWLQVYGYQVSDPSPPVVQIIGITDVAYDVGMGNVRSAGAEIRVLLEAQLGTNAEQSAQDNLDQLLVGELAVPYLLMADPTLGGKVSSSAVPNARGHIYTASGPSRVLTATWELQLLLED